MNSLKPMAATSIHPVLHESDASGLIDWNDDKLREAAELIVNEGQAKRVPGCSADCKWATRELAS